MKKKKKSARKVCTYEIHNQPISPVILWFEVKVIATEFLSLPNDR